MTYTRGNSAMNQYQTVDTGSAAYADPHRLIQMLMEGALMRMRVAKGALAAGDIARKATELSKAMAIVEGLQGSLDLEKGGELAERLDGLYEYIMQRLLVANAHNDGEALIEATSLLATVKSGWDQIRPAETAPADAPAEQPGRLDVTG